MANTKIPVELSSTPSIDDNATSTAITIDSSENVLVGKTAVGRNTAGAELRANGSATFTRSGDIAVYVNRTSSDGTLVQFRKDNATVGNIGVSGGNNPYFSSAVANHGGLIFSDGGASTPQMNPISSGSTLVDNAMNIGSAGYRFKDLYLSGGAYLGGTAAANALDDYEEGSWTPTLIPHGGTAPSISTDSIIGYYTKIGRQVSLNFEFDLSAISGTTTGYINISGLPFNLVTGAGYYPVGSFTNNGINWARTRVGLTFYGADKMGFLSSNNSSGWGWEQFFALTSSSVLRGSITYYTT